MCICLTAANGDYEAIVDGQQRMLTNSVRRACVSVTTLTDNSYENDELLTLSLVPGIPEVVVTNMAQVTIVDVTGKQTKYLLSLLFSLLHTKYIRYVYVHSYLHNNIEYTFSDQVVCI